VQVITESVIVMFFLTHLVSTKLKSHLLLNFIILIGILRLWKIKLSMKKKRQTAKGYILPYDTFEIVMHSWVRGE
jgi:hypothetical protein